MWPALIFLALALAVIADSLWRERRLRRQRDRAKQEFTAQLLQQQEAAALHAQAQQRALFDSMIDGVVLLDRAGKIQLVNDSLRKLTGLGVGAGHGQTLLEAFRLPSLAALAERLPKEKRILGVELEVPGTPARSLEVNASAVQDRQGSYQGAIFVFHDVTRLKELENTRKEFVANVSHELRTPLSLIKGFVETLQDGAKDDPDLAARYLSTIQRHVDRLAFLIEDLLSISQLESGQGVLNLERLQLRGLADRVLSNLQSRAADKNVQLQNDLPAGLVITADGERLEQVFLNLVENAIKYGRSGGRVLIGGCDRAGTRAVEVWVKDDGPGIPKESQPRIFERFYRVDRARSRETGGTGLGLAIVKHIVQAHGGTVWVESEPGSGAEFHFRLPERPGDIGDDL